MALNSKITEKRGLIFIINNAKLLQLKQNNLSVVQKIHKALIHINSLRKNFIANFFDIC